MVRIGFPVYDLLLVFSINIWPNMAPLQNIRPQSLSDLQCRLSKSLNIKCVGAIGLPKLGLLLMIK